VPETKDFRHWDGKVWSQDKHQTILATATTMTQEFRDQAGLDGDEKAAKWWIRSGNRDPLQAMVRLLQFRPGMSVSANEFDVNRHLVTVQNGTLDLDTGELLPHDPRHLLTKAMAANFRPGAECPEFEKFMERVIPDAGMRAYVQRSLGYTLLGDADQRAMFLVYGPSGTGKSTLMSIMSEVFGDYAGTAPSGTLRAQVREQGPSNDLHSLRGRRFVSTSETNEGTLYNEDLIKRLTGRDRVVSRDLYEKNQEWTPVCTLWLATNHPPRFTTDDDAIWRRIKLIPFNTVLVGDGEVHDFARSVLAEERDGILNWLLAGLQDFRANGLGEPPAIVEAVQEQRLQSDPVAQFLADKLEDGMLVLGQEHTIKITDLYSIFTEWARQVGERAMGSRRFNQRMRTRDLDVSMVRTGQMMYWSGIGRAPGASLLGTMQTGWGLPQIE
jgi:putative DNA primase/helicase